MASVWAIVYRNYLAWKYDIVGTIFGDVMDSASWFVILGIGMAGVVGAVNGMPYLAFITPGIIASSGNVWAGFESSWPNFSKYQTKGIWQSILTTNVTLRQIIVAEMIWGSVRAMLPTIAVMLLSFFFVTWPSAFSFILAGVLVFLGNFMFAGMALVFNSYIKHEGNLKYFWTLILSPMYLFSGIYFDVQKAPEWFQTISALFPMTWVVDVVRALVDNTFDLTHFVAYIALVLILTALLFMWANQRYRRIIFY